MTNFLSTYHDFVDFVLTRAPLGVQSRLDERLEHPLTNFTVNTTMKESTSPRREVNEQLLDGISPVFPFFFLFLRKRVEGKGDTKG